MNAHQRPFIQRHLGAALAVLALLAQLCWSQVSAGHWAQMLWDLSLRSDICSVHANAWSGPSALVPENDNGANMAGMPTCPLCSVASVGLAPGHSAITVPTLPLQARYFSSLEHTGVVLPWVAFVRPPAHAPPLA